MRVTWSQLVDGCQFGVPFENGVEIHLLEVGPR
jgi:hypothetical protein